MVTRERAHDGSAPVPASPTPGRTQLAKAGRIATMLVIICTVQLGVFALALLPVVTGWLWLIDWMPAALLTRSAVFAALAVPSYVLFTLGLMVWSAAAMRATGMRTAPDAAWRIADCEWPLLRWVHYMVAIHLVRVTAGTLFRSSPVWTAYLRLNGARVGRRVFVNSLFLSDHNLLTFGDDVVIGNGVHLSGHTVERGVVKTAPVRLGDGVTVGLGSVIDIGVTAGRKCQVAPLSVVLKGTTMEEGSVYAGSPARRIN